jgi:hypothetical protein
MTTFTRRSASQRDLRVLVDRPDHRLDLGPPDVELEVLGTGLVALANASMVPVRGLCAEMAAVLALPLSLFTPIATNCLRKRARNGSCTIAGGATDDLILGIESGLQLAAYRGVRSS